MRQSNMEQTNSLGSRKQRYAKRKMRYSTLIGTGLLVFGTLFVGLLAVELYQANKDKSQTIEAGSQTVQSSQNTQSANPSPSKPTAESAIIGKQVKETATTNTLPANEKGKANIAPTEPARQAEATPAGQTKKQAAPSTKTVTSEKPLVKRHVVQKGETLFKLARLYYGSNAGVDRIVRYNGLDPNQQLPAGKVLMIPLGKQ